jgi:hypothetical protein
VSKSQLAQASERLGKSITAQLAEENKPGTFQNLFATYVPHPTDLMTLPETLANIVGHQTAGGFARSVGGHPPLAWDPRDVFGNILGF